MKLPAKARLLACAVLAAIVWTATSAGASAPPPPNYRVVGTGDSILFQVAMSGLLQSADRWWSVDPGRQVDIPGFSGVNTTASLLPTLVAKSKPGGWVVLQDDSGGVTPARWRQMVAQYVTAIPDDRCLLVVIPVVAPWGKWDTISPAQSAANALAARAEATKQPCHQFVRWDIAVRNHPEFVVSDGKHPTALGQAWLAKAIDNVVGFRA